MNHYLSRVAQSRSISRFGEFNKFSDSLPDEGPTPTVIRRRQSRHRADGGHQMSSSTGVREVSGRHRPFTWAGRTRSASKSSRYSDNRPSEKDHREPAIGSRKVSASGNAAAQRAAIAQNPCAPKRSKIGPQASVRRAVAIPMPTVP
jgi:hypothetical protein